MQRPHPPIWWAGEGRRSLERAAKYGEYVQIVWSPPERVQGEIAPELEGYNQRHGGAAAVALCAYAGVMTDGRDVSDAERSSHFWEYSAEQLASSISGGPRQCASRIQAYRAAGVRHITLDLHRHGQDSLRKVHEQMERFVEFVLPLVEEM